MPAKQPIVYCWRYENQSYCKIGKSSLEIVWHSRLKYAERVNVLDIEILGIYQCANEQKSRQLENHLLNERFDRVRPDRKELVRFNSKVKDWLRHDSVEKNWTIEKLKNLQSPYAQANNERETKRYHKNQREENLKTRARNIYQRELPKVGHASASTIVAWDLQDQGAEDSFMQACLDELGKRPNSTDNN